MPLDHYVSQVHLKNFYSPKLGQRLYALRKSDLLAFRCRSEDVCRIESGSTNPYLTEPRIIEEFLTTVEPHYNAAVESFRRNDIDRQSIHTIAGFIAYVMTSAPAALRIHMAPLKAELKAEAQMLDSQGVIPLAPDSLGGKSLSQLLADGTIQLDVDPKYPQALGITTIVGRLSLLGNSKWDILLNEDPSSTFFTSDYPIALKRVNPHYAHWIVPLTPNVAVRIVPDLALARQETDLTFPKFRCRRIDLRHRQVIEINQLIVRSAEDLVFYQNDQPWIPRFIEKNRHFRIESVTQNVPVDRGIMTLAAQMIVSYPR
jgi:hypothetical protein